jgi:hypothetical protein
MIDALYKCAFDPGDGPLQFNGWPASQDYFPCNGETLPAGRTRYISISVFAAAVQLLLVLGISAKLKLQKRDYRYDPTKYTKAATSFLDFAVGATSLPSLQIIILLVLLSFTTVQHTNTWITVHLGMALSIDLGLHRDIRDSTRFSDLALQLRRRIFFCMYSLERQVNPARSIKKNKIAPSCKMKLTKAKGS